MRMGLGWSQKSDNLTKKNREREKEKNGEERQSHKAWEHIFIDGGRSLSRLKCAVNLLPQQVSHANFVVFPNIFSQSSAKYFQLFLALSLSLSFFLNLIGFYANFDPLSANRIFFLYVICRVSFEHFNCDCCPPMRSGYWTIVLFADSLLTFLISWSTIWVSFASFSLSL